MLIPDNLCCLKENEDLKYEVKNNNNTKGIMFAITVSVPIFWKLKIKY